MIKMETRDIGFLEGLGSVYNHRNEMVRLFIAFGVTLAFSPWSFGILYIIIFFVAFELFYYFRYRKGYVFRDRLALISAAFLGWIVGRYLHEMTRDEDYIKQSVENFNSLCQSASFLRSSLQSSQ